MKRGFTLVELTVVIAVIGILAGVVTLSYLKYQDRANLSNTKSIANIVVSAAKSYKNRNFEYPPAAALSSKSTDGQLPVDGYALASSALGVNADVLTSAATSFMPCTGQANCKLGIASQDKIFYIPKTAPAGTEESYVQLNQYGFVACTYTFKSTVVPNQEYIIAYYDTEKAFWMIERSSGNVTTSDGFWCPFRGI